MASCKSNYSESSFKKDDSSESRRRSFVSQREDPKDESSSEEETSNSDQTSGESTHGDETSVGDSSPSSSSSEDETSDGDGSSDKDENGSDDESSPDDGDDACSEDDTLSEEEIEDFNSEDNLISILYRRVVDVIMDSKRLTESMVDAAIREMRMRLHKAHKRGYRNFPRIDYGKPENCCGYLRRYAICHTGLVKRTMWNFFTDKSNEIRTAKDDIISKSCLKVVSFGGGPGNDLVGFCSALQEIPNNVERLELTIVDNGKSWKNVFPEILKQATDTTFGSFSQCVQKNIIPRFIKADLVKDDVFRDENLSATLHEADLLLMVKFISHFPKEVDTETLLCNVINSMKPSAKLIFIDFPYDRDFFSDIRSLNCIYRDTLRYEMCFKPRRCQSPSIASTFAHVAFHQKKGPRYEDSTGSEDD